MTLGPHTANLSALSNPLHAQQPPDIRAIPAGHHADISLTFGHSAGNKTALRVATYNLFDFLDPNLPVNQKEKFKTPAELKALAQVIARVNADVLMVQELQTAESLQQFLTETLNPYLKSQGLPPYQAIVSEGTNHGRALRLGMLYREPARLAGQQSFFNLVNPATHKPYFDKDALLGHFIVKTHGGNDRHVLVINQHWKSSDTRRGGTVNAVQSQAAALRANQAYGAQVVLNQVLANFYASYPSAGKPVVVLGGDLNMGANMLSTPGIKTIVAGDSQVQVPPVYTPQTDTIAWVDEKQPWGTGQQFPSPGMKPIPLKEVDLNGKPTNLAAYYGQPFPDTQLDYLFVSPDAEINRAHLPLVRDENSAEDTQLFRTASDHDPVAVTLNLFA